MSLFYVVDNWIAASSKHSLMTSLWNPSGLAFSMPGRFQTEMPRFNFFKTSVDSKDGSIVISCHWDLELSGQEYAWHGGPPMTKSTGWLSVKEDRPAKEPYSPSPDHPSKSSFVLWISKWITFRAASFCEYLLSSRLIKVLQAFASHSTEARWLKKLDLWKPSESPPHPANKSMKLHLFTIIL